MDRALLEQQLAELPIAQYEFFDADTLEFSERIRYVCAHECTRYNTSWACPPAVGTVAECEARCRRYTGALLISSLAEAEDISDLEKTLPLRCPHEELTRQVAGLLRAQGLEVLGLSTESCAVCAKCSYPDAPCRHPERMFPCVESYGIVVTELAERFGIEYQYGGNVVTWFSLLLYREAS